VSGIEDGSLFPKSVLRQEVRGTYEAYVDGRIRVGRADLQVIEAAARMRADEVWIGYAQLVGKIPAVAFLIMQVRLVEGWLTALNSIAGYDVKLKLRGREHADSLANTIDLSSPSGAVESLDWLTGLANNLRHVVARND